MDLLLKWLLCPIAFQTRQRPRVSFRAIGVIYVGEAEQVSLSPEKRGGSFYYSGIPSGVFFLGLGVSHPPIAQTSYLR